MKSIYLVLLSLLVGCSLSAKVSTPAVPNATPVVSSDLAVQNAYLTGELQKVKDKEIADDKLGQYAINMMNRTHDGSKLSETHKQILARAIVRVSNDIFENDDHRRAFVAVIAIESQFKRFAQSPTGPKGLTQVAKKTFYEALADCGVTNLQDDDVWQTDINLYSGACYFRKMMEQNNGDPYLAIVAYNQGPASESVKTFAKTGDLNNTEALKYVAKFTFLKRTTTDIKAPDTNLKTDIPHVQDSKGKTKKP